MPWFARSSRTCWRVNCSRARNASAPFCASWSKKRWTAAEIPSKRRCSHTSSTARTRISMEPAIQSCAWTRGACGTNFGNTTPIATADPVVISLPKGSYVPAFELTAGTASAADVQSLAGPTRTARHRVSCIPCGCRSGRGRPGGECPSGVALLLRWEWLALVAGGYAALSLRSTASAGRIMLAVMPSQNLTGDPEQEYLSDGLTEELIAVLGGVNSSRLGIIARTSAMHYKNTSKRADEIGQELGVGLSARDEPSANRRSRLDHRTAHRCRDSSPSLGESVRARCAGRCRAPTRGRRRGRAADDGEPWGAAAKSPAPIVSRRIPSPTSSISEGATTGPRTRLRDCTKRRITFRRPSSSTRRTRGPTAAWPTPTHCWAATTSCRSPSLIHWGARRRSRRSSSMSRSVRPTDHWRRSLPITTGTGEKSNGITSGRSRSTRTTSRHCASIRSTWPTRGGPSRRCPSRRRRAGSTQCRRALG